MAVRNKKKEKFAKNGNDKKKLTKEDKDKLYEIFIGKGGLREAKFNPMKSNASVKTFTSNISRAKSPGRFEKINDDEK